MPLGLDQLNPVPPGQIKGLKHGPCSCPRQYSTEATEYSHVHNCSLRETSRKKNESNYRSEPNSTISFASQARPIDTQSELFF